jgi:D-amino peptidase
MRVFISADIEGCTGLTSWSQCEGPGGAPYDWDFARKMYTHDINAAIRGAKAAGATQVVVKDAHGLGRNLLISDLEPGTELISGFSDGNMMQGLDSTFKAAILVGYHGMAGTQNGIMEHALAGGLHRFYINGQECGEILASAAYAGAHGVPLILVTSDQAGCDEATSQVPGIKTAVTKQGMAKFMGHLLHPSITSPLIEEAAKQALAAAEKTQPVKVEGLVTMRCEFHHVNEADAAAKLENIKRIDGYTVEWTRDDYLQAHRAMYLVFGLAASGRRAGD